MAGYSGTPLIKKLGIKEGHRVALLGAPPNFAHLLIDLPASVTLTTTLRGRTPLDIILLFAPNAATLHKHYPAAKPRLAPAGGLWVCWPKQASGLKTDLTETPIRALALATGLVDNKVCAIDETWSGLRLVVRLKDRPK